MNLGSIKKCSKCKQEYPANPTFFHRDRNRKDGLDSWCKKCKREYHKKYYKLNKYHITSEKYNKLLQKQNYRCAICGEKFENIFLNYNYPNYDYDPDIDHNHKTGGIRGLLCLNCNRGIGRVNENMMILWNAFLYLKNH